MRGYSSVLVLAGAIAFVAAALVLATGVAEDPSRTDFCVAALDEIQDAPPLEVAKGGTLRVLVSITNHENRSVDYTVRARLAGDTGAVHIAAADHDSHPLDAGVFRIANLQHGDAWQHETHVTPLKQGLGQKLEFLLYSPLLRDGHLLQSWLVGCGGALLEVHEDTGGAIVTLDAGDESFHACRIEAWQQGQKVSELSMRVEVDEVRTFRFRYPAGETRFKLYDGAILVMNDAGADQSAFLWLDVT